ncbi:hypothetical protein Hanom_Chr01g00045241 [Helianthus anomalus]
MGWKMTAVTVEVADGGERQQQWLPSLNSGSGPSKKAAASRFGVRFTSGSATGLGSWLRFGKTRSNISSLGFRFG